MLSHFVHAASGTTSPVPVVPFKLRSSEIVYDDKRVMPSYIMTGGNIQIEKSKVQMITEDIAEMIRIIGA